LARDRVVRFAIGIIGIISINEKEKAVPPGEKRKRKQIMPVLITIAALFAVQIYAPAFAGAWPHASDSGYVALKRGGGAGNAGVYLTHQAGEPNSGGPSKRGKQPDPRGLWRICDFPKYSDCCQTPLSKHAFGKRHAADDLSRIGRADASAISSHWSFAAGKFARFAVCFSDDKIFPRQSRRHANFSSPHAHKNT
jgi:hypothetical protein